MPIIDDIITTVRGADSEPVLNQEILQANKLKKQEFLDEKLRNGPKHQDDESKDVNKEESMIDTTKKQEIPTSDVRTLVGYMPKRGDFDNEYDEEAETRI